MRIVVNDIAVDAGGGMSILRQLYQYILSSGDTNEWYFLLGDTYIAPTENIHVLTFPQIKASRKRRLLFDMVTGRKVINDLKPDVVFYLQNTLVQGVKAPQVMYMDQSIPFQQEKRFSLLKREERTFAVYQHIIGTLIRSASKKSDKVIVQTQWLKDAIVRLGVAPDRIIAVHPDCFMDPSLLGSCKQVDPTRFFYPASGAVYKNHQVIYEALKLLPQQPQVILTLPPERSTADCSCVGTLPLEEVYRHLQNSVLVFPSYIESFGLPLLEARQIGTLILAADTAFAREILSGYPNAYYFPTFDPTALAQLMEQVMSGKIRHVPSAEQPEQSDRSGWAQIVTILEEAAIK